MDSRSGVISRFVNAHREHRQMLIDQQLFPCFNGDDHFVFGNNDLELGDFMAGKLIKAEPDVENWCTDDLGMILNYGNEFAFERICTLPETANPPESGRDKGKETFPTTNSNKRTSDLYPATMVEEKPLEKKLKASTEDHCNKKITNQTRNLEENSKNSEATKPNYIRVRARRGQATDSHSLAERLRRQKLSAKMKFLQGLVPGCNMITGKAGMLDEIINYVQSLQRQVQFLSMKLATITPRMDLGMDGGSMAKEKFSAFPAKISCSGLEIGLTALDVSSHMNQIQQFAPDTELQNLFDMEFQQGTSAHFIYDQPFTGLP